MPCVVSEEEKSYYANLAAQNYLNDMGLKPESNNFANRMLCELCSGMSLAEIKEKNLEIWYLDHLFADGLREPQRVIAEIVRLYRDRE